MSTIIDLKSDLKYVWKQNKIVHTIKNATGTIIWTNGTWSSTSGGWWIDGHFPEITFQQGSGTGTPSYDFNRCNTNCYGKIETFPNYTLANHSFVEWNTKSDGSGTTVTSDTIFKDYEVSIFAMWGYKITFDCYYYDCTPSVTYRYTDASGKLIGGLPGCTYTGSGEATFNGWFTSATGGTQITTDTIFTEPTSVYPHFTIKSSGSGSSGPEITEAGFYAITTEDLMDGDIVLITSDTGSFIAALPTDDTTSGSPPAILGADNVDDGLLDAEVPENAWWICNLAEGGYMFTSYVSGLRLAFTANSNTAVKLNEVGSIFTLISGDNTSASSATSACFGLPQYAMQDTVYNRYLAYYSQGNDFRSTNSITTALNWNESLITIFKKYDVTEAE